jgi:serine/threonine-protein kinase TNNI3K
VQRWVGWGLEVGQLLLPNGGYKEDVWDAFQGAAYLLQEVYDTEDYARLGAIAFLASGNCEQVIMYVTNWGFAVYVVAQQNNDGSASVQYFTDSMCTDSLPSPVRLTEYITAQDTEIDQETLTTGYLDENDYRWTYYPYNAPYRSGSFSSSSSGSSDRANSSSSDSDSKGPTDNQVPDAELTPAAASATAAGSSIGLISDVAGGVLAVLLAVLAFVFYRRRSNDANDPDPEAHVQPPRGYLNHASPATDQQRTASLSTANTGSLKNGPQGQSGLWTDDVITAKRIARRNVQIQHLLSRGAFGEVFAGIYNDKRVTVKMLSPETRGIISHVNNFLSEAKMTASMESDGSGRDHSLPQIL